MLQVGPARACRCPSLECSTMGLFPHSGLPEAGVRNWWAVGELVCGTGGRIGGLPTKR
jgi:hypothetical protein